MVYRWAKKTHGEVSIPNKSRNNNIRETISSKKNMLLQPLHFRQVQMMGANKLQNSSKLFFFLSFKTDISFHPDLFLASSDIAGVVFHLTLKGCFPRGSAGTQGDSDYLKYL